MNENTKTITVEKFAPILRQAFIRAGVQYPGERENKRLYWSIEETLRRKVSEDIRITHNSILTENVVEQVRRAYLDAANKYPTPNWYNLLRAVAWRLAYMVAFGSESTILPMLSMPVTTLSHEFNYYVGKGAGRNKRFNKLVHNTFPDNNELTAGQFMALFGKGKDEEDEVLRKMYNIHFALWEKPAQKPEVVEVKDLDKKVVQQMNATQEVELVMNDYVQIVDGVVAGIIKQLEALNQAKAVELDDNEKDQILAAIGYKNVLEEAQQSKKKIAELTEQVERLEKEIANNEDVRKRLLCILGDVAA